MNGLMLMPKRALCHEIDSIESRNDGVSGNFLSVGHCWRADCQMERLKTWADSNSPAYV